MSENSIDNDTILSVRDHVLSRRAAGETVLLSLESEEYYGLDEVGNSLWELIELGTTFGDAVANVASEYAVDVDTLVADFQALLEDLIEANLVIAVPGTQG